MSQLKEIIYLARKGKGLNQKEFSKLIHKSQAMVSKYESGASIPPGNILQSCQDMLKEEYGQTPEAQVFHTEVEELTKIIRKQASGPKQAKVRQAIRLLLDIST
jgi:transcriptional regulator with XRE-family HTH domain